MKIVANNIIFGIRIGSKFTVGSSKIVCTLIKINRRSKTLQYRYFNEYLQEDHVVDITFSQFEYWLNDKWFQII